MFWGSNKEVRNLTQGVLGSIRESGELTATSLREHITSGMRLLVPIDPDVSPWPLPKLFELSHKQAMDLLGAIEDAGLRVTYVVRSDGSIALIRRENADTGDDTVPDRGPEEMPGVQPHDCR